MTSKIWNIFSFPKINTSIFSADCLYFIYKYTLAQLKNKFVKASIIWLLILFTFTQSTFFFLLSREQNKTHFILKYLPNFCIDFLVCTCNIISCIYVVTLSNNFLR
jgi:hypothetical protein